MHGLIFETSVWLLAGSTRLISFKEQVRNWKTQFQTRTRHAVALTSFPYFPPPESRKKTQKTTTDTNHTASLVIILPSIPIFFNKKTKTNSFLLQYSSHFFFLIPERTKKQKRKELERNSKDAAGCDFSQKPHSTLHSVQFHSTKLKQLSQSFNAQLTLPLPSDQKKPSSAEKTKSSQ